MDGREFWLRWRSDILRGAVIFGVVLAGGLLVRSLVHQGRARINGLERAFDTDFFAADRQRAEPWTYVKPLASQHTLWLRNVNGSITVDPSSAGNLEITAERTFRHSAADSVRLVTAESDKGITVCAVWPGPAGEGTCGPDGRYSTEPRLHGNDVAVVFTVRVPRGVKVNASTINGDVQVRGASAPIHVTTVNGDVSVETSAGPAHAVTVNGDAQATIHGFAEPGDVSVTTVHGDATLDLPDQIDAVVDGHTVTGDISTDYPLTVTGKFASHTLAGTLGKGGRGIHLTTVAGDIQIGKASSDSVRLQVIPKPPVAPAPPARPARRAGRANVS